LRRATASDIYVFVQRIDWHVDIQAVDPEATSFDDGAGLEIGATVRAWDEYRPGAEWGISYTSP
jgi:hypothetical protein